ncbi:hypothetical protein [Burkholderia ubonensis]|uniref:hypothetical protein n=1 Tax=Burkholderia ubonensis TaxID=101571 RepID=UPI0012F82F2F|nr:hypothetical protein [Burkholderia ubonensis]
MIVFDMCSVLFKHRWVGAPSENLPFGATEFRQMVKLSGNFVSHQLVRAVNQEMERILQDFKADYPIFGCPIVSFCKSIDPIHREHRNEGVRAPVKIGKAW